MPDALLSRPRPATRALYGLAAALLLCGLAFGRPDERRRNRIPRSLRMLSSALVLLGALLTWKASGARSRRAARLAAGGMGCGLLGDLIMAKVIPVPKPVIGGMLSFGAGHVLYMRAFVERGAAARGIPRRALGLAWAVALAGWWALARRSAVSPTLKYGALAYSLLLASMSGLATSLALRDRRYAPAALGGTLFLASDTLLASELFGNTHFPGIGDVIWMTYIAGQALIVDASEAEMDSLDRVSGVR